MTFETPAYWDQRAHEILLQRNVLPKCMCYPRVLFLDMVEKGLKHLEKKAVDVLKVDLWNEGIVDDREILSQIKRRNANLYGVDLSFYVCSQARKWNYKINIAQATIERLPFKRGSFDLLLDLSTLDHISLHKTPIALREYRRVLRTPGILVLIFDYFGIMWKLTPKLREALIYKIFPRLKPRLTSIEDYYVFQTDFIKSHMKNNGFKIIEEYSIDILGWIYLIRKIRIILEKIPGIYEVMRRIENTFISKHLKPFARQYVIIAHT